MKQLIKMSDYVLEQIEKLKNSEINILQFRNNIEAYANFLKQPLTIGMFVPCDRYKNVLKEPYLFNEYQQAKAKVLFEGFKWGNNKMIFLETDKDYIIDIWFDKDNIKSYDGKECKILKTIEDLIPYNLELTDNQF